MFPTNKVRITKRVKAGTDTFGDDLFGEEVFEVSGVVIAPLSTRDLSDPQASLDDVLIEIFLPKAFTERIPNSKLLVLSGSLQGREFLLDGDALPYDFSPLSWNRRVIGSELRG